MAGVLHPGVATRLKPEAIDRAISLCLSLAIVGAIIALFLGLAPGPTSPRSAPPAITVFDLHEVPPPPPIAPPPPPPLLARTIEPPPSKAEPRRRIAAQPSTPAASSFISPDLTIAPRPDPARELAASAARIDLGVTAGGGAASGSGAGDGAAGGEGGGGKGGDGGGALLQARWVTKPTPEDLRRFNPARAEREHIVGRVVLACRVRLNHHVHDCRVLAEKPKGYGLGAAARRASAIFRVWPPKHDGKPVDGAWVGIPIDYDLREELPKIDEGHS